MNAESPQLGRTSAAFALVAAIACVFNTALASAKAAYSPLFYGVVNRPSLAHARFGGLHRLRGFRRSLHEDLSGEQDRTGQSVVGYFEKPWA
jgi:hypothetical protein